MRWCKKDLWQIKLYIQFHVSIKTLFLLNFYDKSRETLHEYKKKKKKD